MKILKSSIWIFVGSIVCYIAMHFFCFNLSKVNENDFVFNFLGILLGFSLTVFIFIVSLVEKIKEKVETRYQDNEDKKNKLQSIIDKLYIEIKDDIFFTFFSLVIISLAYIFENSIKDLQFDRFSLNKAWVFNSIRLSIFLLNLYAIYDLIIVSFELSDTVGIIKKIDDESSV